MALLWEVPMTILLSTRTGVNEVEQSVYAFALSDAEMLFRLFDTYEKEAVRAITASSSMYAE